MSLYVTAIFALITPAIFTAITACKSTRNEVGDSKLAAIEVTLLTRQDLINAYGSKCEKLKFNPQDPMIAPLMARGNQDNCSIAETLLSSYRLNIIPSNCDRGSGTAVDNKVGNATNKIGENLQRGCDYSVSVDFGYEGKYFLSNQIGQNKNLLKADLTVDPVKLTVKLYPTDVGSTLGFTRLGAASATGPKVTVEFSFPEGWLGTTFLGNESLTLSRHTAATQ